MPNVDIFDIVMFLNKLIYIFFMKSVNYVSLCCEVSKAEHPLLVHTVYPTY